MIHKRGLSLDDIKNIDPDLFEALLVYDTLIEPNGARIEMIKYANLCHTLLLTSQSLSKEGRNKAKLSDWDFLDIIGDDSLTARKKVEKRKEQEMLNHKESVKRMGEMIKQQVLKDKEKAKNGKK